MAVGDDKVSVKHLWCWGTLLRGRFTRFVRFSVAVNQGSTFELKTTLTDEALGAKAAADAGNSCGGIGRNSRGERREWSEGTGRERRGDEGRAGLARDKSDKLGGGNTNEKVKNKKGREVVLRRSQDKGISLRASDTREKRRTNSRGEERKRRERRARGKGEGCYTAGTAFVVRDGAMRCDGWAVLSTCITATTRSKKKKKQGRPGPGSSRAESCRCRRRRKARDINHVISFF